MPKCRSSVKRLYGFGDVVYVGLASPPGVAGIAPAMSPSPPRRPMAN